MFGDLIWSKNNSPLKQTIEGLKIRTNISTQQTYNSDWINTKFIQKMFKKIMLRIFDELKLETKFSLIKN